MGFGWGFGWGLGLAVRLRVRTMITVESGATIRIRVRASVRVQSDGCSRSGGRVVDYELRFLQWNLCGLLALGLSSATDVYTLSLSV